MLFKHLKRYRLKRKETDCVCYASSNGNEEQGENSREDLSS